MSLREHTLVQRDWSSTTCKGRRISGWGAYAQSKLANPLFTYELARHLDGTGNTANALHPGYVDTGFALNNGSLFRVGAKLSAHIFGRKPELGTRTSIYLASSPEVEGVTGRYFHDCTQIESSPASYNQDAALKLWQVSMEMTAQACNMCGKDGKILLHS